MTSHSSEVELHGNKNPNDPSPANFEVFLPWACTQLQLHCFPKINRVIIANIPRATTTRGKVKEDITSAVGSQSTYNLNYTGMVSSIMKSDVHIDAIYDTNENLVQLKFKKNYNVPESLLKLISLIIQFYPHLTAIYINKGLKQRALYQVSKIVAKSNITEVILDNTVLTEANYYLLLEKNCSLKYLSLARCMLNDNAVKELATKLEYPSKASTTLVVLNLSTNRITDVGAKYLGDMLRINRQLAYLNLSGNMITDKGADSILSSLITFRLTTDEISDKKARKFDYMKEKRRIVQETIEKMRNDWEKKYAARRKTTRATITPTKRAKSIIVPVDMDLVSISGFDEIWLEKAQAAAEESIGRFQDPFNLENTIARGEALYCYGNNALCYLNLAYNNLTYFSVQQLHNVISIQQTWDRKPTGLINVRIEGNNLPKTCKELTEIDILLESGLANNNTFTVAKKKPTPRK